MNLGLQFVLECLYPSLLSTQIRIVDLQHLYTIYDSYDV